MKNPKRPSRKQKEILKANRLNPDNWLICKNESHMLEIVHRVSGKSRTIPTGG